MAIAFAPAAAEAAAPVAAEAAGSGAATTAGGAAAAKKAPAKKTTSGKPSKSDAIDTVGRGGSKKSEGKESEKSSKGSSKPSAPSTPLSKKLSKNIVGRIDNKKILLPELIVCLAVLIFGTLVAPKGSKDDVHRLIVKGSALMAVFFILAILSTGGNGAKKTANTLGFLITLAYLLNSSDIHNVLSWVNSFFKKPGTAKATTSTAVSEGSTPEGSVNSDGTYTSTNGYTY